MNQPPPTPPVAATRPAGRYDVLLLGLLAFGLSLAMLAELRSWPGLLLSISANTDMGAYVESARGLIRGEWPGAAPFYRAPLYPYALAVLIALGRTDLGAMVGQAVLFAAAAMLLMATTRREVGRLGGWCAGLGLVGYGGAAYTVAVLHSTVVELFLASLLLYVLARWRATQRRFEATEPVTANRAWPGLRRAIGSSDLGACAGVGGLVWALLCLIRPNFLLFAPLLAGGLWLTAGDWRRRWRALVLLSIFGLVAAGPLLAVIIHNNRYSSQLLLLTTNAGSTFRIANSERSPVFNYEDDVGAPLSPRHLAFWQHQARKAVGFWWDRECPQNDSFYLFREQSLTLRCQFLRFSALAALFLVGLFVLGRRLVTWWPYLAFFAVLYGTVVAFFIIGRFRVPGMPAMLLIGAAAIVHLYDGWRQGRRRPVIVAVVAWAVLVVAMNLPRGQAIRPQDYYNVGICALQSLRLPEAEYYFLQALQAPDEPVPGERRKVQEFLAVAVVLQEKWVVALAVVENLQREAPEDVDLMRARVTLLRQLGRPDLAASLEAQVQAAFGAQGRDRISEYAQRFRDNRDQFLRRRRLVD